ncbi:MAG: ferrous iron transport protein B [Nitrospirae bacterium]|nr:ferrous iron transport protein B [Nitrospirota bacterium]
MKDKKKILVAFAGQPNVGKSTVFNILTGLSQHVGNWPGKTVEKKEGIHITDNVEMRLVDLPGTYTLTAFSEEEKVARDFIINEQPDVIVLVANATSLEKNLYLLSELLLLGPPVIVGVNMMDVAEEQGIHIEIHALSKSLGVPVIPMIATKNKGIKELVSEIISLTNSKMQYAPKTPSVSEDHKAIFNHLEEIIGSHTTTPYRIKWVVTKLMEGDPDISKMVEEMVPSDKWDEIKKILMKHEDSHLAVVRGKYNWIRDMTSASISHLRKGQILLTDRIDQVLTRPLFGIPILLGMLALVFFLTYKIGSPLQEGIEGVMSSFARWIEPAIHGAPIWVAGMLIDGVIGGAGTVLTFLPILIIFFTLMVLLEDVGYMARAAFVMDRFMHIIGLHGKSFLPMFLGFGCNVPAILGARIVESKKAKLLTILLTPFVPCTARLAVLAFISSAFFGKRATFFSCSIVTINILALGIVGIIASRFFIKGEPTPFIMELPLYHKPNLRTILISVKTKIVAFLKRAGTVILGFSVLLWFLSNFPGKKIEESILGIIGHLIEPLGTPIGLDWRMILALISSFIAKENSIATLGILFEAGEQGLSNVLPLVISHASAISFLVISMLFIPCMATMVVMKQEMASWKWFLFSFIVMLLVSFISGTIAYNLVLFLGI